ncbi:MAG: VOC family protein [Caldilineae bacterium]|nr:VOC family protein [Anaerolineae bacterium]MCB0253171.1 VOC family protein [Anaerolineae bacterium]MCB9152983.1 VOC family protein [Caldilineae bacterium]
MTTYTEAKPAGTPTWIDLATPDAEGARAFYKAVFGWDYDIGGPEYGGYTTARVGQNQVAGIGGNVMPDGSTVPVTWSVYFASENAEADVASAVELGAKVLLPPMAVGPFGTMANLVDPGGAVFSYWQAGTHIGAEVMDEPGSVTWFELCAVDVKQSRDFYAALLGTPAEPLPGDMEYYAFKHGDAMLGGVMQIAPSWGDFQPQWVVYFAVANADETVAAVVKNGGKALSTIDDTPYGRMAAVADPFGAYFKVLQLPAR